MRKAIGDLAASIRENRTMPFCSALCKLSNGTNNMLTACGKVEVCDGRFYCNAKGHVTLEASIRENRTMPFCSALCKLSNGTNNRLTVCGTVEVCDGRFYFNETRHMTIKNNV